MGCTSETIICTFVCYVQGETLGPYDCGTNTTTSPEPCCPDPCTKQEKSGPPTQDEESASYTCTFYSNLGGSYNFPGTKTKVSVIQNYTCEPISPPPPGCATTTTTTTTTGTTPPPGNCQGGGG